MPNFDLDFLFDRTWLIAESYSRISTRQQERISKSYEKDLDHAVQSELLGALHRDAILFRKTAF